MAGIEMNYEDIKEICKENLKIQSLVKSIKSIFLNERFMKKIDYKPYFQRNYVWDDEKATYFIESILLGTEIPPLVFFQTKQLNEIIDGRQRFETIQRFISDKLELKESGLHRLKILAGKKYSALDSGIKEIFESTKIRILQCSVVNEPKLTEEKEDKIKKEIFRRYNSGITPLLKEEIARAEFIDDLLTKVFKNKLSENKRMFLHLSEFFLPKRKKNSPVRDQINIILNRIRTLITLPYIPIYSYAHGTSKADIVRKYYYEIVGKQEPEELWDMLNFIVNMLDDLRQRLKMNLYKDNTLIYEGVFWGLSICLLENKKNKIKNMKGFAEIINSDDSQIPSYMWRGIAKQDREVRNIFEQTGSHYYKSVNNRYLFISNYFGEKYSINFKNYLKNNEHHKKIMESNTACKIFDRYKLSKPDPVSITIYDIVSDMKDNRFMIRPPYQRSEVVNQQKSSYLLESMLLGIKVPPLFIYKRKDGIKEVIDGQQRLLTLIGFLGESYLDENGFEMRSQKDKFKLNKLRILDELNGKNIDVIDERYKDILWDFPLDIVEIDEEQNPDFSAIDLFLRLNTKPYPIKDNTFEMWNAYIDKQIIMKVREIAKENGGKVFRPKDKRMKNEELITTLAYLEYRYIKDSILPHNLLDIYIRNRKLSGRIKGKENVTKVLSKASEKDCKTFIVALEKVEDFIGKITSLVNADYTELGFMFANKKGIQYKTDQNFYFLWMMLHDVQKSKIEKNRKKYAKLIRKEYEKIQKLSELDIADNVIAEMRSLLS